MALPLLTVHESHGLKAAAGTWSPLERAEDPGYGF